MAEFGRVLLAGERWVIRLTFVDEEHVDEDPAIQIHDPADGSDDP